jgi:hypothetical protein
MNIFNQMIDRTINAAGEWNAQLFRELKGRLNPKNFTLTLLGSFAAQVLMMMMFVMRLPVNLKLGESNRGQEYCFNDPATKYGLGSGIDEVCKLDKLGHVITNWPHWWTDILVAMSWVIGTIYLQLSLVAMFYKSGVGKQIYG